MLKIKPLKNDPKICHSNYANMFMEIGMAYTHLTNTLVNYDPQYIPFFLALRDE